MKQPVKLSTGALSGTFQVNASTRPKSADSRPKAASPRITLRLSERENAQLRKVASGVTLSSYIRECLFGKEANLRKTRQRHKPVADEQAMAQLLAMLGESRIANNLNQLAYKANIGELVLSQEALSQIEEAYGYVGEMRSLLIQSVGLKEPRS